MDPISLITEASRLIDALVKMKDDLKHNKDECRRLLGRIQGLEAPLDKIKQKEPQDVSQQPLLKNVLITLEEATEFVGKFRKRSSIWKIIWREDYKKDFEMFHKRVNNHVSDLNLGEAVRIHDELEGMADQLVRNEGNQQAQMVILKEIQRALGEQVTLEGAVTRIDTISRSSFRYTEVPKHEVKLDGKIGAT